MIALAGRTAKAATTNLGKLRAGLPYLFTVPQYRCKRLPIYYVEDEIDKKQDIGAIWQIALRRQEEKEAHTIIRCFGDSWFFYVVQRPQESTHYVLRITYFALFGLASVENRRWKLR